VLITLIFLLIGVRYFYLPHQNFRGNYDPDSFKKEVIAFRKSLKKEKDRDEQEKTKSNLKSTSKKQKVLKKEDLFEFNPNTLPRSGWKKLGLNERITNVIINYRKSGGKFFKKEDLKKIYGLDQTLYSKLEPFISLNESQKNSKQNKATQPIAKKEQFKEPPPVINVNKADTFRLLLVNGIGPTYAKRICKYRELLGGFYRKKQLKEVYGINDSVYKDISRSLKMDTSEIDKIDLNNATFKELIKHPYISAYQTKAILKYIKYKGSIGSSAELLEHNIFDKETYDKVNIYLKP
jgi:DNA uptake protein ComE-like DNA-binding protein